MSYHLEDAELLSKLLGEEIELPSLDARADLRAGEIATLLFSDGAHVEPLRVQVVDDTPGRYLGMLIEEPGNIAVDPERPIRFDEYQVAWIESPSHAALSGLFDWARPAERKGPPQPQSQPQPPRQPSPGASPASERTSAYPAYAPGTERIPMDAPARPPVFYLPGPVAKPLIQADAPKPSKGEGDLFSWAKPPSKKGEPLDVSVYKPGPQSRAQKQEEELLSMWSPEALKAEREQNRGRDISDVIVPEETQGSMYRPRQEAQEAASPRREEPRPPAPRSAAQKSAPWSPPSVAWMKAKLAEIFDLKHVWAIVREDRESEYFQDGLVNGGEFGDGARTELQTVSYSDQGNWVAQIFDFFGVDYEPVRERVDAWIESDDYGSEWEDIQEEVIYPLYFAISEAFDELKPKDLPGSFIIADYHDGLINLAYNETEDQGMSKEEFGEKVKGRADKERVSQENRDRASRDVLQGWVPPPPEAMIDFLEGVYGIDALSSEIRKGKKKKLWKEGADEGIATFLIDSFGDDDGGLEERLSDFFGVKAIYKRFLEANLLSPYWDYVLYPLFEQLEVAWEIVRPDDLPGDLTAGTSGTPDFDLYYEEED